MISFLFWNLMGNQETNRAVRMAGLRQHIARMAESLKIDVFLFAESPFPVAELTATLDSVQVGTYCYPVSNSRRIQLFTRLPGRAISDQFNDSSDGRLTIRNLTTPLQSNLLLAVLHFQSQMAWSIEDQALQATVLQRDIADTEDQVGHQRTILVGDLNMNPFDLGVVGGHALNAVMTRDLARAEARTIAGRDYRFFYNPMWGYFGDRTAGPPGTYYYNAASPRTYYWNMFDQVLLRPTLMDALDELRILDSDGQVSLLTDRGRPRSSDCSDHLPVLFRLKV